MIVDSIQTSSPVLSFLLTWAVRIALALIIFFVGRLLVKWIVRFSRKHMERYKLEDMLVNFICNILNWALLFVVIIAALNQVGVDTTALIAVLGAGSLAVGLALQDSMKNFASGVMLIIFHPFKTGDFVEAGGTSGIVETITLFTSTLRTPDNREVIVPNGSIYNDNITNYSARETRRVDMVFGIGYEDDIRKAKELLHQIIGADTRILAEPAPLVAVGELADSSVNFNVRPWVKNADYWDVFFDVTEKVKLAFDDHDISIPYPQMDVYVHNGETQEAVISP